MLGFGLVTLSGETLSVDVVASGLTPGEVHPLHIHGFADGTRERLAVAADDLDCDRFVETPEGESQAYGPVIAGLLTTGEAESFQEVSPDFPVADAEGRIVFSQEYELDEGDEDDAFILEQLGERLDVRVLEFHGLDLPAGASAGTPNEVDGAGGYDPQVPVAQGQLIGLDGALGALAPLFADALIDLAGDALGLLAPYTMKPDGTGLVAEEPEGTPGAPGGPEADSFVSLLLPSNGSGVLGVAAASFDEEAGNVTINLAATGLTPGEEHPPHIHGFTDDRRSLLPKYRLDDDLDGLVEDQEGAEVVAPVLLALTENGSIGDAALAADFPVADADGNLVLSQTYSFDASDAAEAAILEELQDRFTGRALQIHGLEVPATEGEGSEGEVDGTAGYKARLPVANGILLPEEALGENGAAIAGALADLLFAG